MKNHYISRMVLDELSKENGINFMEYEIEYIERNTEVIELRKNEYLVHKDDTFEYLYFLEKGILQCSITEEDEKGKEREFVHRFINRLNMVNGLCDEDSLSIFDIKALENCKIWRMHKDQVETLYKTSLNFNLFSRKLYNKALKRNADREQMMRIWDAKKKYVYLMKNESWIILCCPQKSVASYLDITPQTLSNIRKSVY